MSAYAALLSVALLVHQLWWTGPVVFRPHGAIVLAAIWCLGRPASERRLLLLAATATAVLALDWPHVADHLLLVLGACAGTLLLAAARRPLWEGLAPLLRAEAVLLYGAAAFAKLNHDFLDPATSCAGTMALRLPLTGDWVVRPAIVGALAAEVALAVLLAVPRTRRWGVALGLGFHAVLALAGNVPFAAVMAAVYVAFVPTRPWAARSWLPPVLAAAWIGAAVAGLDPGASGGPAGDVLRWGAAVALVSAAVRLGPGTLPRARLHPALGVVLGLLVLNAAAPYLGLKTQFTFSPFSNLRTAPGAWNHLLVPEGVRVFGPVSARGRPRGRGGSRPCEPR